VGMTDVAATELIAESSEDREQGRDEVADTHHMYSYTAACNLEYTTCPLSQLIKSFHGIRGPRGVNCGNGAFVEEICSCRKL